jgi:6-phosphogluconolactonase
MTDSAGEQLPERFPPYSRYTTRNEFVGGVAAATARALRQTLDLQPTATLAVPGGRTMAAILPELAGEPLAWGRITVTLIDERWVAPNHPDSNEAILRTLFQNASPAPVIHGLFAPDITVEDRVRSLSAASPPDIVLVSMADDGHIGSLFPGHPANEADTAFAAVRRPDHMRITMTPKLLRAARTIVLAVDGSAREQILLTAQNHGFRLPVRHVLRPDTQVHVLR